MLKQLQFILLFVLLTFCTAVNGAGHLSTLKIGEKAPDFTINDPEGNPISLSSLQGKVILIDFWASWCGYCKNANEEFIPVYNNYKESGFDIFSVSVDIKKDSWLKAIKNQKLPWSYHGSDLKGWEHSKVAQLYQVEVLPATILVDENGIILDTDLDEYDLEKKLNWYYNTQVRFYPITSNSKLFITSKVKFQIEDTKGNVLLKGKEQEIDISTLEPGEYKIKYDDREGKFVKRVNAHAPTTFFPERVEDKITFSVDADFEIYSATGKLIKQGRGTSAVVTELPAGLYYISIDGNLHQFYKK